MKLNFKIHRKNLCQKQISLAKKNWGYLFIYPSKASIQSLNLLVPSLKRNDSWFSICEQVPVENFTRNSTTDLHRIGEMRKHVYWRHYRRQQPEDPRADIPVVHSFVTSKTPKSLFIPLVANSSCMPQSYASHNG